MKHAPGVYIVLLVRILAVAMLAVRVPMFLGKSIKFLPTIRRVRSGSIFWGHHFT